VLHRPVELAPGANQSFSIPDRYNATAIPFDWRFGRTALNDLLQRVKCHERNAA
jgi:hypothetical protein